LKEIGCRVQCTNLAEDVVVLLDLRISQDIPAQHLKSVLSYKAIPNALDSIAASALPCANNVVRMLRKRQHSKVSTLRVWLPPGRDLQPLSRVARSPANH